MVNFENLKTLVITSCSGEKKFNPSNPALAKELDRLETRIEKEKELAIYQLKAREMFVSGQNIRLLDGIEKIRDLGFKVDLSYISSGYGLLEENDLVVPYDVNLAAMSKYDLDKRSEFLGLNQETSYKVKNYDLVFYLLSAEYLRVLRLPLSLRKETRQIFFASSTDEKLLPQNEMVYTFFTGLEEANGLNVKQAELKGHIFRLLCQEASHDPQIFTKIYHEPKLITDIVQKNFYHDHRKKEQSSQLNLFDQI